MRLGLIKQIGLIIFSCGVIALSSVWGLTANANAAPSPFAAMEEMADDATTQIQESAEDAKKAVEEGIEEAKEKAKDVQEGMEKTDKASEQAESEAKENGEGIIDKVKSLFSGD